MNLPSSSSNNVGDCIVCVIMSIMYNQWLTWWRHNDLGVFRASSKDIHYGQTQTTLCHSLMSTPSHQLPVQVLWIQKPLVWIRYFTFILKWYDEVYLVTACSVCSCTNTVCIGQHRQAINFLSLRQSIFTGTWSTGNSQFYIDLNSSAWGCTLGPRSFLFGHWLCCGLSCVNYIWRLTGFQWQGWIKAVRQAVEWWKSSPPQSDSHQSN